MACLCEFRCAFLFLTCFWLQIAHICHLLLWRSCCFVFLFFLKCRSVLPTAKCSFRETSHQKHEKLKTVTTAQTVCFCLSVIKMDFSWRMCSDFLRQLPVILYFWLFPTELAKSLILMCMNLEFGMILGIWEPSHPAPPVKPSNLISSLISSSQWYS